MNRKILTAFAVLLAGCAPQVSSWAAAYKVLTGNDLAAIAPGRHDITDGTYADVVVIKIPVAEARDSK